MNVRIIDFNRLWQDVLIVSWALFKVMIPTLIIVKIAQETVDIEMPDIIVGSSRGGAVALNVNPRGAKLVLIAPAWKRFGADTQHCDGSTVILHCTDDKLVDYKDSEELSDITGANLIPCGKSHRMDDPDALDAIIDAVKWCSKR